MAMRVALMLLALFAVASRRPARAEDNAACAKYQEPLAYNACLASHGPRATDIATSPGLAQGGHAAHGQVEVDRPAASPHRRQAWAPVSRHRGRFHMEFRVK